MSFGVFASNPFVSKKVGMFALRGRLQPAITDIPKATWDKIVEYLKALPDKLDKQERSAHEQALKQQQQQEIKQCRGRLQQSTERLKQLESEYQEMQSQSDALAQQQRQLEEQLAAVRQNRQNLEQKMRENRDAHSEITGRVQQLGGQLDSLQNPQPSYASNPYGQFAPPSYSQTSSRSNQNHNPDPNYGAAPGRR